MLRRREWEHPGGRLPSTPSRSNLNMEQVDQIYEGLAEPRRPERIGALGLLDSTATARD